MVNSNSNINSINQTQMSSETFAKTFISTFLTVFIAELGDKTQIATLLLSAGSGKPILVFIGAATALICTSLIGVILGSWLSQRISDNLLNNLAGFSMLLIGLYLLSDLSLTNLDLVKLL